MDDSSVEEEMESTKSKIKSVEEEIESVKSKIKSVEEEIESIKSTLGITSENVLGNTNHLQYNELKSMLSSNKIVMSSKENRLSELYKLLRDMREEARGESFVMGGYNQLLQPYNLFAELVLTSYTWTRVHCYLHIAKQFHALT